MDEAMQDKPVDPPPPDEVARRLEDFIRTSLGGQVVFAQTPGVRTAQPTAVEPAASEPGAETFEFHLRPAEIKAHLDRYVIRQDEAKKVLATAVCDHYNHARMLAEARRQPGTAVPEFSKQNVLIVGPTGVGKTYLVKHIAELVGVPFVKADATKFSETGYVGADVDDLVRDLVAKANGDIALAEHGIIYLDEIDKLATGGEGRMGRDVSGRGVQTALLKLMEETEVPLHASNDIRGQMQMMFEPRRARSGREVVNTRNILFIVSGAFAGLEKRVEKRVARAAIGFGAEPRTAGSAEDLLREAQTGDFIDYGFEAEFIGRLPVRVFCEALDAGDLFQIMKRSEGSLIRQLEREFHAYGVAAVFEDEALREVAERAALEKTGARGLVTVWEKVLRDFKFEMPSLGLPGLVVDRALVERPAAALERCRERARSLQSDVRAAEVRAFADKFRREHGLELVFDDEALLGLVQRAGREGVGIEALCTRLFKDFPFGLQLVARSTSRRSFAIHREAVERPDKYLSDLVVHCYRGTEPSPPRE